MKEWIEQLIITHPKLVLAAFGLFALIFEALTGVTVTVGNEAIDVAPV